MWYEGAEIEDKYDVCKLTRSQYIEVSMLGNRGDILQAHKLIEDLDLHVHQPNRISRKQQYVKYMYLSLPDYQII